MFKNVANIFCIAMYGEMIIVLHLGTVGRFEALFQISLCCTASTVGPDAQNSHEGEEARRQSRLQRCPLNCNRSSKKEEVMHAYGVPEKRGQE